MQLVETCVGIGGMVSVLDWANSGVITRTRSVFVDLSDTDSLNDSDGPDCSSCSWKKLVATECKHFLATYMDDCIDSLFGVG